MQIDEEKKRKFDEEMEKYEMIKNCISLIDKHIFGRNDQNGLGFLSTSTQNLAHRGESDYEQETDSRFQFESSRGSFNSKLDVPKKGTLQKGIFYINRQKT